MTLKGGNKPRKYTFEENYPQNKKIKFIMTILNNGYIKIIKIKKIKN